jgi:tryptophan 6-halogenase
MYEQVVIVGGGTAGWMTASYLKAAFRDRIEITLVESGDIRTIGVGEATFSDIRHFFEFLGLREEDWMPKCNATYKLGIRFQEWRRPGHHFFQPFEQPRSVDGFPMADWWLHNGVTDRFDTECFVMPNICEAGLSPRRLDGSLLDRPFDERATELHGLTMSEHQGKTQFPYAYHFEAALLAEYLASYSVDRGVKRIIDNVTDVALDERGWITGVATAKSGVITGGLFIDCTGFRGLLLNKTLGEPFISFQDTLPNDSAVALQVPQDMKRTGITPYTGAAAQKAGWIWTIPLYGRIGTGYVYSSDYCTPEEAEHTVREFVGPSASEVTANHIKMRIGRSRRSWVNNCVGIGLTSGFVEPLESTGIFFIHHAAEQLVKHFPDHGRDPVRRDLYNSAVANVMDGVREFLIIHYKAAARNDTEYWKDVKDRPIPDELTARIETWKHQLPDTETIFPYYHGIPPHSYICIILGMGGIELRPSPALRFADETAARKEFEEIRGSAQSLIGSLPTQYEYFTHMRR